MDEPQAWKDLDPPWQVAFELAWEAFREGTVPVGAVVVDENGTIVAQGRNRIFASSSPVKQIAGTRLAHAEVNALTQLSTDRRWKACTLYTTLEPCVLCVAAASVATVGRICFAGAEIFSGSSNLASIDLGIPRPLDVAIEGPSMDLSNSSAQPYISPSSPRTLTITAHSSAPTRLDDRNCSTSRARS